MDKIYQKMAHDLFEISSEQRLGILLKILKQKSNLTSLTKEFGATTSEIHRNLNRLVKAEMITKNNDRYYQLTTYGKIICAQIQTWEFLSNNKNYFTKHQFDSLPQKFLQRIGALSESEQIKGFVKVQDRWKKIYQNSEKYIYNILYEIPYNMDILKLVVNKVKEEIQIQTIFTDKVIVTEDRKELLKKSSLAKFVNSEKIERRVKKNTLVLVLLNDKEACIMFPNLEGEIDVSQMLYSSNPIFHEWALDYFRYCWYNSSPFREAKIK